MSYKDFARLVELALIPLQEIGALEEDSKKKPKKPAKLGHDVFVQKVLAII